MAASYGITVWIISRKINVWAPKKKNVLFHFGKSCDCTNLRELNQMCVCDIFRSGAGWDEPPVQTLSLHHPAEGEAAEGDGGAAGHRRGFSLPFPPQSSSQTPPPALQTVWLRLHRLVWPRVTQLTHHSSVSVVEVFQFLLQAATRVEVFPDLRGRMEVYILWLQLLSFLAMSSEFWRLTSDVIETNISHDAWLWILCDLNWKRSSSSTRIV